LAVEPGKVSLTNGPLYNDLAWVYEHRRRSADAARVWEASLVADPHQAEAHFNLARLATCAGRRGDPDIRAHLERAIQLRPEFVRAKVLLERSSSEVAAPCPPPALAWPLGPPLVSWEAWRAIERDGL
jgi:hypothetical protein